MDGVGEASVFAHEFNAPLLRFWEWLVFGFLVMVSPLGVG